MRRLLLTFCAVAAFAATVPSIADAQSRDRQDQQRDGERAQEREREREFNPVQAPLQRRPNAGPCPFVKVLYDASRYVEFEGGREASGAVAWSGEIQGLEADCVYREDDPIRVDVNLLFGLGKGPRAEGSTKTFRYWVAVTERNETILAKQWFDLNADFGAGDRLELRDSIEGITIPRADATVSGAAFEILIGFEVTPEQAAFNRAGKRFRIDAGQTQAASQGQTQNP